MKRSFIIFSVLLSVVASPFVHAESAQPLTDQYIASIKAGCTDALRGILQVQKTEAATRVNRGREYETLLRLVAAFNSRVVINKLDAPVLTSTTARLQTTFTDFQEHYLQYADKVDATLKINCKQAPVTFYDNLTAARDARSQVASDVTDMNGLLNEYQKGLDTLKASLPKLAPGATQ